MNVVRLLCMKAVLLALAFNTVHPSFAANVSEPTGVFQIEINPGPNCISVPLQRFPKFRGDVESVAGASLTVSGNPAWIEGELGVRDGFHQFIVLVRKSNNGTENIEGDWWPILGNGSDTVTVANRGEALAGGLVAGDQIEIRRLTSVKDIFGTGPSFQLNRDSDGIPGSGEEDAIRFLVGTSYSTLIFYHDGSVADAGYYTDTIGPVDGSTITLQPNQPMIVFRKAGSPALKITTTGKAQITPLTHYLQPGSNAIGLPFPITAPIGLSGLRESGWIGDANGVPSPSEDDIVRLVTGTSFDAEVFYHSGALAEQGWYMNGEMANGYPLEPSKGYVIFISGIRALKWRQSLPVE